MRRRPGLFALLASALLAGGCGECTDCAGPALDAHRCDAAAAAAAEALQADAPVDMLLLSGGGMLGAYGAGVLNGWSQRPPPGDRRRFAVVTGVSTGALQATHAFLGRTQDPALYRDFTQHDSDDFMAPRPFWELPFADSIMSSDGLEEIIAESFTDEIIDAVAAEHGKRLLCVGAVHLNSGRFAAWDMTAVAADQSDRHRYRRYRSILQASSSIPVLLSPVILDDSAYVDGGVREKFFALDVLDGVRASREGIADRIFVIANEKIAMTGRCADDDLPHVATQSLDLMSNEILLGDLEALASWTEASAAEVGLRYIPDAYVVSEGGGTLDADHTCRLFCRGHYDGRRDAWEDLEVAGSTMVFCEGRPFPPGDGLGDSHCPRSGDFRCPADDLY